MGPVRIVLAIPLSFLALVLASPAIITVVAIGAFNRITRLFSVAIEPRHVEWQELLEFDADVGWKPKRNMNTHCLTTSDPEVFHVVTDSEGWPGLNTIEESEVVVFGDSIAFGYAIDFRHSFTATAPGVRVKAIGAPGYNLVQELILMRKLSARLSGKLVVWLVFYGNDLYDNLSPTMDGYRTPFIRQTTSTAGWEIVGSHVSQEAWRTSMGRRSDSNTIHSALRTPGWLSDRAFSACEFILKEGRDICIGSGASLAVIAIPHPRDLQNRLARQGSLEDKGNRFVGPALPDEALRRIGLDLGIPIVLGSQRLEQSHFRPNDGHWNRKGHLVMARLLSEIYKSHEPVSKREWSLVRAR